jgi:hypothetical protein
LADHPHDMEKKSVAFVLVAAAGENDGEVLAAL